MKRVTREMLQAADGSFWELSKVTECREADRRYFLRKALDRDIYSGMDPDAVIDLIIEHYAEINQIFMDTVQQP
jgi:hypothetical protein